MRPGARIQAAIEILDDIIASAKDNGPPADAIVRGYFKTRRYAGSKDRRAVREMVFAAVRRHGDMPVSGRAAMLGLAEDDPTLKQLFDGAGHGPQPIGDDEAVADAALMPDWIAERLSPLVSESERAALLERAPLDLRVNVAKTDRESITIEGSVPTPMSPMGLRLEADTRIDHLAEYRDGRIEVQDEASQLAAMACAPGDGETILDLCAGAGGKALALAAMAPAARIIASDVSRARMQSLAPRAERAGALIEARLLDMPNEAEGLSDLQGQCDLVLIDAPCSGSGTWRRNPEGRWRLNPHRLDALVEAQARLIDLALPLVKPGGRLVYAVCSLLAEEGAGQAEAAASRHSDLVWQDGADAPRGDWGRPDGAGRLLTPGHDGTDGFFFAVGKRL